MRIPHRHLSRREAERLLDDPAGHGSALGSALAAAAGPAQPGELGREDAAAAVFQRTAMVPSPGDSPAVVPVSRSGGRAALRAVVATSAVVALATGGFALAGSADLPHIPGLPGQASDRATESAAKDPQSSEASSTSDTPGDEASGTGGAGTSGPGTSGSGTSGPGTSGPGTSGPGTSGPGASGSDRPPSSSTTTSASPSSSAPTPSASTSSPTRNLQGLCRAFQATDHSANGKSLDSTAFAALADAAGGADRVAAYCVDLIGPPKVTSTPTSKPTDKPTGKPTDKPTGKPTDKPTGKPSATSTPTPTPTTSTSTPTDHPTGKPTDKPTGKPSSPPGKPTDQPSPTDEGGGATP